jgi:integrase
VLIRLFSFLAQFLSGQKSYATKRQPFSIYCEKFGLMVKHCRVAAAACPSLKDKRVTVHVLRHTMALDLLQAGVDRSVIALWLGHESIETTQIYLEATLAMKEQALARTAPLNGTPSRYRPGDQLLAFLNGL